MHTKLKWFSVMTTFVMLCILLGGALVTKTDSGMGCGRSWPLCHGQLIPENITPELVIELAHRVFSGVGTFMVAGLALWSWKAIGRIRETKFLAVLSISFLIIQALIGAAAVIWSQSDFVMALHFGISLISFAAVLLLTLLIFEVDKKFEADQLIIPRRLSFHFIAITIYSYLVIYTGALVRHTEASLVCPDWPFCFNNAVGFNYNMYQWIQMGHRLAAGLLFIWIVYLAFVIWRHHRHIKVMFHGWNIALILVSLQVIAGAFIIYTRSNLYIALMHALFISCLFGLFSYFLLLVSRNRKNSQRLSAADRSNPNKEHSDKTYTAL
ncbi:heme A synthase [Bacillus sp. FJAT-27916]|uniref:COX15/CtaA family protein n=1 Tax=Bacillaceae TaxID=186817 RepID=UPI000671127E|nr:heme A synthase [Bacillus sp. FJAT-27916]KMY45118.1 heme A synthase [Bacillus sp. FJAT-27916]